MNRSKELSGSFCRRFVSNYYSFFLANYYFLTFEIEKKTCQCWESVKINFFYCIKQHNWPLYSTYTPNFTVTLELKSNFHKLLFYHPQRNTWKYFWPFCSDKRKLQKKTGKLRWYLFLVWAVFVCLQATIVTKREKTAIQMQKPIKIWFTHWFIQYYSFSIPFEFFVTIRLFFLHLSLFACWNPLRAQKNTLSMNDSFQIINYVFFPLLFSSFYSFVLLCVSEFVLL